MPVESKKAALARIDGEVYVDAFEAEFGQWPGKPAASDGMDMGRVDDVGNDSDIDSIDSERATAAGTGVLEDDVGDYDVDLATAEPMSIEDEDELDEKPDAALVSAEDSSDSDDGAGAMGASGSDTVEIVGIRLQEPDDDDTAHVRLQADRSPQPTAATEPTTKSKQRAKASKKKPSARVPRGKKLCQGFRGQPCKFSTSQVGQRSRVHTCRKEIHCAFCSPEALHAACASPRPKVLQMLKKLWQLDQDIAREAVQRIRDWEGVDAAGELEAAMKQPVRKTRRTQPTPSQQKWADLLARRKPAFRKLDEKKVHAYEMQVRGDRRLVRRKVFFPENLYKQASDAQEAREIEQVENMCGPIADMASNDTGLPSPKDSVARAVEEWCKQGSWGICQQCGSVQPRPLRPADMKRSAAPEISAKACTACRHGEYVPQPADIPEQLRDLKTRVLHALRPLDVDTGTFQRAKYGYRIHSSMISFAWAADSVDDKIEALRKQKDRDSARRARNYLLDNEASSSYASFYERHNKYLGQHGPDLSEKDRKLPLRFIEEEGLECALWPHLYWQRGLCETVARASHEQRRKRQRKRAVESSTEAEDDADGSDEESGQDRRIACSKLGRIKRGFIRKVLSPVIGYGTDYELLHFVYDLSIWTTVGTKKNIARQAQVPLRLALSACPWTPQYWRIRHQAVVDMQRQCGNAALFRTRAPYEKSFPYHVWVMHEQRIAGRPRLHLAGAETLHQAHILLEMDKGFFCGARTARNRSDRTWSKHLADAPDTETVLAHVTRLEFQDGKRKRARQDYHERGTTHSHSLDYLQNKAAIGLERKISAHVPSETEDPLLRGLVLDGQRDYTNSGVEMREEPSAWDEKSELALLQHTEEDKDLKVRPYFPQAMAITKCHEDVQQGNGNGAVLRYVATYAPKFSDSMDQEWLNDHASDYSVARRILFSYHPLEPEMWLTLAQERFPQIIYSGTMLNLMTPSLDCTEKPRPLQNYETSTWRGEDMSFLDYLRKSNASGEIVRYIREKHKREVLRLVEDSLLEKGKSAKDAARGASELLTAYKAHKSRAMDDYEDPLPFAEFASKEHEIVAPTLEDFANSCPCRGEKLVAAGITP